VVYAIVHCDEIMQFCDDDWTSGTGAKTCPFEHDCNFINCDDSNLRIVETTCTGFWIEGDNCLKVFVENITADKRTGNKPFKSDYSAVKRGFKNRLHKWRILRGMQKPKGNGRSISVCAWRVVRRRKVGISRREG
jgi:hypothetical protein